MTTAAETITTTLRYKAVTSKAGYRRLEDCMLLMGRFYNTVIQHRENARIFLQLLKEGENPCHRQPPQPSVPRAFSR